QPLRREIKVWHNLRHPNIVRLLGVTFGFGTTISTVSPWISEGPLHTYLAGSPDLTDSVRFRLVSSVSSQLQSYFIETISCGRWKGNVLVDGDGRAFISDFGLCSILGGLHGGSSFVRSTCRPGTIRWAAPELVLNPDTAQPSTASDVFSFGCIMLQILSGQVPWGKMHENAIVLALDKGRHPPRPDHRPICDRHWAFVGRCFSGADVRPPMDEVVDFISTAMIPDPLGACPRSSPSLFTVAFFSNTALHCDNQDSLRRLATQLGSRGSWMQPCSARIPSVSHGGLTIPAIT
ncbi:kinase-like domain-containing protein, partial [Melanogaster broomeanus]